MEGDSQGVGGGAGNGGSAVMKVVVETIIVTLEGKVETEETVAVEVVAKLVLEAVVMFLLAGVDMVKLLELFQPVTSHRDSICTTS